MGVLLARIAHPQQLCFRALREERVELVAAKTLKQCWIQCTVVEVFSFAFPMTWHLSDQEPLALSVPLRLESSRACSYSSFRSPASLLPLLALLASSLQVLHPLRYYSLPHCQRPSHICTIYIYNVFFLSWLAAGGGVGGSLSGNMAQQME